jgi:hypothetical protein
VISTYTARVGVGQNKKSTSLITGATGAFDRLALRGEESDLAKRRRYQ